LRRNGGELIKIVKSIDIIFERHIVYWNTNRLYVRLHNFLVCLFIQRFSQHVSVVCDHHQAVFIWTLTPVFLLLFMRPKYI
jgi:hypothetical protein